MSTTIYESPDEAEEGLTIDITFRYAWFFGNKRGEEDSYAHVIVDKEELPAIYRAIGQYLEPYSDD